DDRVRAFGDDFPVPDRFHLVIVGKSRRPGVEKNVATRPWRTGAPRPHTIETGGTYGSQEQAARPRRQRQAREAPRPRRKVRGSPAPAGRAHGPGLAEAGRFGDRDQPGGAAPPDRAA